MSKTLDIRKQQNLFDIAMMNFGSWQAAFDIAIENNIAVTEQPEQVITEQAVQDRMLVKYLQSNNNRMATGADLETVNATGSGSSEFVQVKYTAPVEGYNVRQNQNLFDIALQLTGSWEKAFDLALLNNVTLTETLTSWQLLKNNIDADNVPVLEFLRKNNVIPATSKMPYLEGVDPNLEGIGYWAIEIGFQVS